MKTATQLHKDSLSLTDTSRKSKHRRLVRFQKQVLQNIRAEIRRLLGSQSRSMRSYYAAYKREFTRDFEISTKTELLQQAQRADVILLGDYHTFNQSQRTALRILRDLVEQSNKPIALCLEMVPAKFQNYLNDYSSGKLNEEEFLKKIQYDDNWGFSWQQFKPLLEFAKDKSIALVALNTFTQSLDARDQFAAAIIAETVKQGHQAFVVYGDLHLARSHIPKHLRKALASRSLSTKNTLTLFQNSETVYWKLAEKGQENHVDLVRFSPWCFCVMNATPWVKLQSYLQWAESDITAKTGEEENSADQTPLDDQIQDFAQDRMKDLLQLLEVPTLKIPEFNIRCADSVASSMMKNFFSSSNKQTIDLKVIKWAVLQNQTVFSAPNQTLYLPAFTTNSICEGVGKALHVSLSNSSSFLIEGEFSFHYYTLHTALSYFASKLFNHKRKCSLPEDFKQFLKQRRSSVLIKDESTKKKAARVVVQECKKIERGKYRFSSTVKKTPLPIRIEAAHSLGCILGERLFHNFHANRVSTAEVRNFFQASISQKESLKKVFLNLLEASHRSPMQYQSRTEQL